MRPQLYELSNCCATAAVLLVLPAAADFDYGVALSRKWQGWPAVRLRLALGLGCRVRVVVVTCFSRPRPKRGVIMSRGLC